MHPTSVPLKFLESFLPFILFHFHCGRKYEEGDEEEAAPRPPQDQAFFCLVLASRKSLELPCMLRSFEEFFPWQNFYLSSSCHHNIPLTSSRESALWAFSGASRISVSNRWQKMKKLMCIFHVGRARPTAINLRCPIDFKKSAEMCGGPEHYRPNLRRDADIMAFDISLKNLQLGQAETSLLELAADNDLKSFRHVIEQDSGRVNEVGNWYGRRIGCNKMGLEQRTPLMIAALYGSVEVVEYILSLPKTLSVLVNQTCGSDGCTALHCAAAGAAIKALQVVKLLLEHGADKTAMDSLGRRPADVICVPPNYPAVKVSMELALCNGNMGNWISATTPANAFGETSRRQVEAVEDASFSHPSRNVTDADSLKEDFLGDGGDIFPLSPSPSLSSSPDSWSSPSGSPCIPSSPKGLECSQSAKPSDDLVGKLHESPLEVPIPDIKNSIYTTDEFRMFSFKVRPCSRAYSHDWTECPFVHPGENARRRDPRRYHYSCVPCPDFRKGACRRGDACEYAHGVFECWLHPAQYRTRLCKDGTSCARRVCFFAHTAEELRPLYVSTNSAIPSPRASSSFDARSMSPPLPSPLSPIGAASPFSPSSTSMNGLTVNGMATPPLSPSSHGGAWAQANVPSRLRTTVSARDIPLDEQDFDGQLSDFFHGRPSHAIISGSTAAAAARMEKYGSLGLSIPPINLEDMFASEVVSALSVSQLTSQDHSHVSPQLHSQLQSDMLSPLSAHTFLHAASQNQLQNHSAMQGTVFGIGSPRPNSPVIDMPNCVLPTDITSELQARRLAFAQRASWSSREFAGSVSPGSWSDWGSPSGKPDWGVQGHDLSKFRKSASFASHGVEPDLSWVQKLVKETPNDTGLNHLKE